MDVYDFVKEHATRGECTCGKCIDGVGNPEDHQPTGNVVDLTFFKVGVKEGTSKEEFEALMREKFPNWFDGKEHNYLQGGGEVGDQGVCLTLFGMGHVLGVWKCLCPETVMPTLPDDLKQQMAGCGMISIEYKGE